MTRPGPIAQLRSRLEERAGPSAAAALPDSYQRLGRVLVVRWPEPLRPHFSFLAEELRVRLGAATVLRIAGPVVGEWRLPRVERLAGSETETELQEDGLRYRFDAARILYSRGNNTERARAGRLVRRGETVVDLFAGIGYFALPAALHGRAARVIAVEENPLSFGYLEQNIVLNRLEGRVDPLRGDNRRVEIPGGEADRVFLGFLPTSLPWIGRAVALLRPEGGWLHVHLLGGTEDPPGSSGAQLRHAVEPTGRAVRSVAERVVKPYGPGREHRVVDAEIGP
jgi:tRNA wybutosine-synthesizing protein 2